MRIPDFYCPHCGRFKKWFQIETWEYTSKFFCKHCGSVLIDTEDLFLDIVKQVYAKAAKCQLSSLYGTVMSESEDENDGRK